MINLKILHHHKGFTLIEIMVVVVILGILASVVVPNIINRPDQAKVIKAQQDILALENALELYRLDNGIYPTTDQGLKALIEKPTTSPVPSNWRSGGYIKRLRKDPWNKDYLYMHPGIHGEIDIFSFGADRRADGKASNADIGNWDVKTN